MDVEAGIKIAKDKKSTPDQLKSVLGLSDEIDLFLAKHPNTSAEMLDDICFRQSHDEKISAAALVHPNLNDEQLFDVGMDYPLAAYKNPRFAELQAKDKKYLDQFFGTAFENSFKKALPQFVVEWLVSRGKEAYQLIYVSAPKRSEDELAPFRASKHPKVVATLLDQDLPTYKSWAVDVGFELTELGKFPGAEVRLAIDQMIHEIACGDKASSSSTNAAAAPLVLPVELFSVLNQIEGVYFKKGRLNLGPEATFYEDFHAALQSCLNSQQIGKLAAKVVEFDLAEIKRFGSPGKRPPANINSAGCCRRPKIDSLKSIVPIQN